MPGNAEAYSSLSVIEIIETDYAKAAEYGQKAWQIRQDLPSIPANLAVAYHYLNNDAKKRYFYDQAKRLKYHRLELIERVLDGTANIE